MLRVSRLFVFVSFLASFLACDVVGKPNVLFIAADDLRVELGCYGQKWIHSPNLDRLAGGATRFTRAYCQAALCNPSRASLLTGLYPDTLGVIDLPTHFRHVASEIVTLPQHFKNNGYFTRNIGKVFHNWHHGDLEGDPNSWSVPAELHYATHSQDTPKPDTLIEGQLNNAVRENLNDRAESYDVPDEAYFDGRIAEKAVAALTALKDEKAPFFLAVGFWKPHLPFNAPKKYWDIYATNAQLSPPLLPEQGEHPKGMPKIAGHPGQELMRSFKDELTEEQVQLLRHGYYAAVSYLDAQVGKLLDAVDELGLGDDTIIVFWSDHGFHLGEKGLWCKNSCFDLDTRVPLIIRLPGQRDGRSSDSLVELIDLYPTLLELCDLPMVDPLPGQPLQGSSLAPILSDPSKRVRFGSISQIMRPAYSKLAEREAMGYTIRGDRFRFTQWVEWKPGMKYPSLEDTLAEELYDLETDPLEVVNLVMKPSLESIRSEYRKRLSDRILSQRVDLK